MSFCLDLAEQTERLALERFEQAVAMKRDVRARQGRPLSLEQLTLYSVLIAKLKGLAK